MFRLTGFLLALWAPLAGAAGDPSSLQLRVVEGDGYAYALGSRSTRGVSVEVTDDTGNPVEGATVSFRLPEQGPTGLFANKSKTDLLTTGRDGRASVWGMQWNRTPGVFEIRITASKGEARAGIIVSQALTSSAAPQPRHAGGGSHKWLWAALAVAGGAGGGVLLAGRASSSAAAAPSTVVTYIGSPTITLGKQQ